MRAPALALAIVCAPALAACPGNTPETPDAGPVFPAPHARGEGSVHRLAPGETPPLAGYRSDASTGDWVLENQGTVAVVSSRTGKVVDCAHKGDEDALVSIESTAFDGLEEMHTELTRVEGAEGLVRVDRRVTDRPIVLSAFIYLQGPVLKIESVAARASAPEGEPAVVTLGEIVHWGNVPTWVEGHGFIKEEGSYAGSFIAREGFGRAYALESEGGRTVARFGPPDAPGFHPAPHTGEEPQVVPPGGESRRRLVAVATARGLAGDAAKDLPRLKERATASPASAPGSRYVEVARCAESGAAGPVYARFEDAPTLPPGCFFLRLGDAGAAPGAWVRPGETPPPPLAGTLAWSVHEKGSKDPLPARLLVRGADGTSDPDWGDEPTHGGAALNVISSVGSGEVPLAPGRYEVLVNHGFEYTARAVDVTVSAGKPTQVNVELEHAMDTAGWISADLHVHAVPSPDAPTLLEDRVRALAASGVELAVATDHNAITDYAPSIRALGLASWLVSVVGDEVTTRAPALGHYNVFPLQPGSPALLFSGTEPRKIFAAARAAPPDLPKVIQVNHPRMGDIGYFELLRFDPGDVEKWTLRSPLAATDFDALEIFNGDDYAHLERVEHTMKDWYALLNAGLRVTATGNSDSHKLVYQEAGVPRNYVEVGDDTPGSIDVGHFLAALKQGMVVVSSGPFVTLEANGKKIGEKVDAGESVPVTVKVSAPPWIDVDRVELVKRGEVIHTWTVKPPYSPLTTTETLKKDDWLVAIARGSKPMTFLYREGAQPFAFTNPIWVQ
jgi:hypothetical protein